VSAFAISRTTLFSLLLGLLLASGIRLWAVGHRDDCDRYMAGETKLPASQWVVSGTRTIEVPCNDWVLRQPMAVQLLCLADLVLIVVFVLHGLGDARRWFERRGQS